MTTLSQSPTAIARRKSKRPTNKWLANAAVGGLGMAVMLLTGDRSHVTDPEVIAVGGYLTQLALTYWLPNANTPGGVPVK